MNLLGLEKKICVHVGGSTIQEFLDELEKAQSLSSFVELRIDFIENLNEVDLETIHSKLKSRSIVTCRSSENGGLFSGTESRRLELLFYASCLGFKLIDIELSTLISNCGLYANIASRSDVIISYHNFEVTHNEDELINIYLQMNHFSPRFCKIATMVNSEEDAAILFKVLTKMIPEGKAIIIGMGELGRVVRLLAPIMGSKVAYSVFTGSVVQAPGAIDVTDFISFYQNFLAVLAK